MRDGNVFIDDITWNDLELDLFFRKFNNTCSQNGGEYFYDMLRRPLISGACREELKERGRVSELFKREHALRDKYIEAFGSDEEIKQGFHERLDKLQNVRRDSLTIHFSALFLGLLSLIFIFIYPPAGFILFIAASVFNVFSYFKRKAEIDYFRDASCARRMKKKNF